MRLEHDDRALVVEVLDRVEQRLELARMVGVVVIDICAVVLALELEAAACAVEAGKAVLHRVGAHAEADRGGSRGESVLHIVHAGDVQRHIREQLPLVHDVELGVCTDKLDVLGVDVSVGMQAEGDDLGLDVLYDIHGVGIVMVCDDVAVLRHSRGKLMEGVLHIVQILEEIEMVGLNVQHDSDRRMQREEGVIILAGLHDDGVAVADAVPRLEQRQRPADHDGGVFVRGHHDVRAHRGRGGLAVSAAYAQGVVIVLGYRAPGLGALEHRDALGVRGLYLRVLIMHRRGAHDEFNVVRDVLRVVADGHRDALLPEVQDVGAFVHVRAGDVQPHAVEHFGQRGHGHSAYAYKMPLSAGGKKIFKFSHICLQIWFYSVTEMVLIRRGKNDKIICAVLIIIRARVSCKYILSRHFSINKPERA